MIIKNKKQFIRGIIFSILFWGLFPVIFLPIYLKDEVGNLQSGLQWANNIFNKMTKDAAYFIPEVAKSNEIFMGKIFSTNLKMDKPEDAELAAKLFTKAGAKVEVKGAELKIEGDLGKILAAALKDSETMYRNEGEKIRALYGYEDEKKVMRQWWSALDKINKQFLNEKKIVESEIVSDVITKAVEPAYNYYKIAAIKIEDKVAVIAGLLIFYVAYALLWGSAIVYLLGGLGITLKKAAVKKEV